MMRKMKWERNRCLPHLCHATRLISMQVCDEGEVVGDQAKLHHFARGPDDAQGITVAS